LTATFDRESLRRWTRASALTALSDGTFASVLNVFVFHSTVTRLWQGVASVLLGRWAIDAGVGTAIVGVLMHIGVAFGWSLVFLAVVLRWPFVQRILATRLGWVTVAAVYGPCIWLVMSLVFIPLLLHRPPTITERWWIQLAGHFPFVGIPIVATLGRPATK
jgi:hypothetical protein